MQISEKICNCCLICWLQAMMLDPENVDSVLISNRGFCQLNLGYGEGALTDAHACRAMRPGCAHSCWLQGYSYVLLQVTQNHDLAFVYTFLTIHSTLYLSSQDYKKACDAFLDGLKLKPGFAGIEKALRLTYLMYFSCNLFIQSPVCLIGGISSMTRLAWIMAMYRQLCSTSKLYKTCQINILLLPKIKIKWGRYLPVELARLHGNYCWKLRRSDALLMVSSGMCRQAMRLLKESDGDEKKGQEGQRREAHLYL